MSQNDGLDRRLTAWLDVEAAPYAPTDLRMRFADGVGRTRQRPAWATTERWISMETRARLGGVPRLIIILATIGLLAALSAGAIVIGSDGPARNGRIAFVYQGDIYTVAPDGTDRQLLVEGAGTVDVSGVVTRWDAAGVLVGVGSAGAWQLMVVDADGTDPIVVASGDVATRPLRLCDSRLVTRRHEAGLHRADGRWPADGVRRFVGRGSQLLLVARLRGRCRRDPPVPSRSATRT